MFSILKKNINNHFNFNKFLVISLALIFLLAAYNQSKFLLNWDVSWCTHVANIVLHGGDYVKDFFDVNLPLTYYLYIPSILLKQFFSLDVHKALIAYIFILSGISLFICGYLSRYVFKEDKKSIYLFLVTYALLLLIFPQYHFGQREHLLFIFTMPFFLLLTIRFSGEPFNSIQAFIIGLFAGIGFVIKPYFLITFLILELFYCYQTRKILGWMRIESLTIGIFSSVYVLLIFLFYPSFIYVILPLTAKYFYVYASEAWKKVIFTPAIIYCLAALFCFILFQEEKRNKFQSVLGIALVGFLFNYFIQRSSWTYHILPALSLAIILFVFVINSLIHHKTTKAARVFIGIITLLIMTYPIYFEKMNYHSGRQYRYYIEPLISFIKKENKNKVYFLSTNIQYALPPVDYTQSVLAAHFAHMPLLPGILAAMDSNEESKSASTVEARDFVTKMVVTDLKEKQPDLVFIDISRYKGFLENREFDYLNFFSQNLDFRNIWKNYHYKTTIENLISFNLNSSIHLYFVKNLKTLPLIKNPAIIIIGSGNKRIINFYQENHFLTVNHQKISFSINLSNKEVDFLNNQTSQAMEQTSKVKNQIMQKSLQNLFKLFPVYKFDVYEKN